MDLTFLSTSINPIIVGICLCVGYVIKNIYANDKINKYIPLIMACLGLVLSISTNLNKMSLEIILSGLFSGLVSTGLHQAFKSLIKGGE